MSIQNGSYSIDIRWLDVLRTFLMLVRVCNGPQPFPSSTKCVMCLFSGVLRKPERSQRKIMFTFIQNFMENFEMSFRSEYTSYMNVRPDIQKVRILSVRSKSFLPPSKVFYPTFPHQYRYQ